ncbi:MAG: hypothetical protein SNG10_03070 [Rikenellaceae bacterium]
MIRLYIDGVECDTNSESTIVLNYSADSLVDIDEMSEGVSVNISIPSSAVNDEIMGGDGYIHAPRRFNSQEHTAQVWCKGEVLFEGDAFLAEVSWSDGEISYSILIRAQRAQWATAASQSTFKEMAVELDMKLAINRIEEQWESDDPVRFVVVKRDTYTPIQSSVSNEAVRVVTALEDFHPFLNIDAMMRSIFESNGYRVESRFMDSDYFKSLYMSGSFGSSTNSTETRNAMDFYVKRSADCTVEGDYRGRVYMSPYYGASSVGMIVDPDTVNTQSDCYSYGGCFQEYESVPAFVPLVQVYIGFEVRLRYITPYKIQDRLTLQGYNSVHLCVGHDYEFDIPNNFVDKREELSSNFSYMLCIFDFDQIDSSSIIEMYLLKEDGLQHYYMTIDQRVTYFETPQEAFSQIVMMEYCLDDTQRELQVDWAIYNGYIQESGSTEVDVTLRITPSLVSPSSPLKFDETYIDCGVAEWEFTLLEETSITPYFAKHPGVNAFLTFEDVARHDCYQISLVESIAHMYNLRFWSDDVNKVVYVEPYDDMWDRSKVWDWSDKIDPSHPIEISDLAEEVYKSRKWGYIEGDGVTSRGEGDIPSDDEYGFWSYEIDSLIAKDGTESLLSPLYSPSQNNDEGLLQVGDRDDVDNVCSFDFTPRIVRCDGSIEYDIYQMPYMSFYDPDNDISLCFEDRGGVVGLNSYYTEQIDREQRGRIVSIYLKLTPFDVASLFSKCEASPNILSLFGLNLGGDMARCLLKEIVEYDPLEESVKCRFIVVD